MNYLRLTEPCMLQIYHQDFSHQRFSQASMRAAKFDG